MCTFLFIRNVLCRKLSSNKIISKIIIAIKLYRLFPRKLCKINKQKMFHVKHFFVCTINSLKYLIVCLKQHIFLFDKYFDVSRGTLKSSKIISKIIIMIKFYKLFPGK